MKSLLNEIFNELVNKYKKFFSAEQEQDASKDTATNRLRFVLMHDRTNLSPETMEKMRDELVDVISKYVVIDTEALDLNLAAEGDAIALLASIPILRAKTKEEQEEAIRALEAKRQEEAAALNSDEEDEEDAEDEETSEEIEDQEEEEDLEEETEEESGEDEIEEAIGEDLEASEEEAKDSPKKKSSK